LFLLRKRLLPYHGSAQYEGGAQPRCTAQWGSIRISGYLEELRSQARDLAARGATEGVGTAACH